MHRISFLISGITLCLLLSCNRTDKYADSVILGDWQWQYPIFSDSIDISASYWAAHDAYLYRFLENGVYIKDGGPDPIIPQKYCYEIVGDTLLHLYISSVYFYDESYKITKISPDTIWLMANPLDKDHNRDLKMSDSEDISFLVKY